MLTIYWHSVFHAYLAMTFFRLNQDVRQILYHALEEVPQATEDGVMTRSRKLEDDKKKKKKRDLLPISSSDKMRKLMLNFITKEEEDKLGLSWAKLSSS